MKKIAVIISGLVVLLLIAVAAIPLFVDVDKYRPQIVQLADQNLNGSLELGKLNLSLWGQVRIEIAGLKLKDRAGQTIVAVNDAYFHLPFLSILSGSPELTLKMDHPLVDVVKDKNGKLNILSLVKTAKTEQAPSSHGNLAIPAIAARARLGIELQHATVGYKDLATGLVNQVQDLNFVVKDISLSHPAEISLWADLDTQMSKTFHLHGPVRIDGEVKPKIAGTRFEGVDAKMKADFDSLEVSVPGVFEKKKGIPANIDLAVSATDQVLNINRFITKFFNAEIDLKGSVSNPMATSGTSQSPVANVNVNSNTIELKPWVELLPIIKEYGLGGTAQLSARANGPTDKLTYAANFKLAGLTAKAPHLKAQPKIDGLVDVVTDKLNLDLTMKAPANDLAIQGKLVSFSKPNADFQITSSGLDLDSLIDFPKAAQAKAGAPGAQGGAEGEKKTVAGKSAPANYDAMLDPIRKNPMLASMAASVGIDIKSLKFYGVKMDSIQSHLFFKDLSAGIERLGLKVFGGSIHANAAVHLRPQSPTYEFGTNIAELDLKQAVESQFTLFKNTVLGTANFDLKGTGASFNPDPAIADLKAKGSLKVTNATFASIDMGKMASEAINKAVARIAEKVPQAKGKTVGVPAGKASKYDLISSDFTISGGKFEAPNFVAKAAPNQGIDVKGSTELGLKNNSLNAHWEIIDTYNITHARDLSVDVAGTHIDHLLAEGNSPVKFPISIGCTAMAPCYSYEQVPESLAKVAMGNVSGAATGRAKSELRKHAEGLIQNAPPSVQDKLKKLFQ